MLSDLQNMQLIDPVTDSTESTESREQTEYQRREVDRYTKRIVDVLIDDPCISVPGILRQLAVRQEGVAWSCGSERSVVHLFGGPSMFRKTCERFEVFRWALVTHCFEVLPFPIDLQRREWGGQCRYSRKPESNDDWVSWWAPDMFSLEPFEPMECQAEGIGMLYRFPVGEGEDDYFREIRSEEEGTNSDVDMTEAD